MYDSAVSLGPLTPYQLNVLVSAVFLAVPTYWYLRLLIKGKWIGQSRINRHQIVTIVSTVIVIILIGPGFDSFFLEDDLIGGLVILLIIAVIYGGYYVFRVTGLEAKPVVFTKSIPKPVLLDAIADIMVKDDIDYGR